MGRTVMNEYRQIETLHAHQASAWVEILRQPTTQRRAEFVAWLKESPRNVHDFLSMYALDQALNTFDPDRRHDIDALVALADRNIVHVAGRFTGRFKRTAMPETRRRYWRVAAIAAGVVLVGLFVLMLMPKGQGWQEFRTVAGEQRAFELEDGSVMYLNIRSRVALRFSGQARDVKLIEGEALFKVHHDPSAPFRVHTGTAMIQAVGTQFNVHAQSEGTEVSVIEGRVKVSSEIKGVTLSTDKKGEAATVPDNSASISLTANEVARIDRGGAVSVRTIADANDAVAWRERRLIFREDTLAKIVQEFNRYNREQIRLKDPAIADRVYTGVFDADDPNSLVEVLARETDLAVEHSGEDILVKSRW
jgi:transmembrane sensor